MIHGELVQAQAEAEKAVRQHAASSPEWAWRFRLQEGDILLLRGQTQQIVELLNPDLPPTFANGELSVKRNVALAIAYFRLGQTQEADAHLAEADAKCSAPSCPVAGELARAHGVIEVDRNQLPEAENYFRQSLDFARRTNDEFLQATALLNLGVFAVQQGRYDESIHWSREAQEIAKRLGASVIEEKALGNLGWAYYKLGDFEQAEALFNEAIRRAREIQSLRDEVEWLNTVGLVYYQKDRIADAEASYKQSLALAKKIQDPYEISGALSTLAFVSNVKGDTAAADQYCQEALQLAHANKDRASELFATLIQAQIRARQGNVDAAEKIFQQVEQDKDSDVSLRWEAEGGLSRLYEQEQRFDDADQHYREAVAIFEQARASLDSDDLKLAFLANALHLYDDYIRFLVARGRSVQALQLADYSRAQTLAEGLGLKAKPGPLRLAGYVPQKSARKIDGVVLFYWLGQEQSYLWAITNNRVNLFTLPAAAEVEALVDKYNKALLSGRDVVRTNNQDGVRLYETLVVPAQDSLKQATKVVIVADGALTNLNFETLLVPGATPHFWVEDVTLLNTSSLRLLAAGHQAEHDGEGKLLLIGDPVSSNNDFGALPKAAQEIADIERHFPPGQRKVLAREQATSTAYLASQPGQYAYIHFVAHGTASVMSPLDSAVILSPATTREDSFKLYARDIIHQPLHADLVTISTCYGAGARTYTGEGLVGLSWAFLRAGAHNVIGALWEVSDDSTPQLMDQMYAELGKGRPPDEALRAAKLAMLHSDSVFRKPFYWAPFQLYTGS